MLKNIFYKKKEIDINKDYINNKKKDVEIKKQEIRTEFNRWGKIRKRLYQNFKGDKVCTKE